METLAEIQYTNVDGEWNVVVSNNELCVTKDGESRIYNLDEIESVEHDEEYITLHCENENYYVVKLEENNFLVIDLYDEYGEHLDEIGCFVFGED